MSCFFCNSMNHLSQFCDIYDSNDSRIAKTFSKNCCSLCLSIGRCNNADPFWCISCRLNKKCNICFTKDHHTVYCPDRNDISSSVKFLPNIDNDLISRYLKILNIEEQTFLAFSFPAVFQSIKLHYIYADATYPYNSNIYYPTSYKIITDVYISQKYSTSVPNFENLIFKAQKVSIKDSTLTAQEFLLFLSFHTKELICSFANFTSTFTFTEILQKIPNIRIIEFCKTNVIIANSWPQDLMERKRGNDFECLKISLNEFNFDVQTLETFIKTKSSKFANFDIYINNTTLDHYSYAKIDEQIFANKTSEPYEI